MLQGHQTWVFKSRPTIISSAAVGGPHEAQGPLADDFDLLHEDIWLGQDSFEKGGKGNSRNKPVRQPLKKLI